MALDDRLVNLVRLDAAVKARKRLRQIDDSLAASKQDFSQVRAEIGTLFRALQSVEARLGALSSKPDAKPTDLGPLNARLTELFAAFEALTTKVSTPAPAQVVEVVRPALEPPKPEPAAPFAYRSFTLGVGDDEMVKGTVKSLRAFAAGRTDAAIQINDGDEIAVREGVGFDLHLMHPLDSPTIFCAAGTVDIFVEL